MSLSTFDNLKLEIIDWSKRGDIDLKVDTFIQMAETEMYANPVEVLRVRGQETRSTATTDGQYLALPDDFQSLRGIRFVIAGEDNELVFRSPEQMQRQPSTGRPEFFTVTSQIEFNRVPDDNYTVEIHYFAKPTPLSSSNATNEVLAANPNIYLFGALWAVFKYAIDEPQSQLYYSQFINAVKGTNRLDKKGRYGPAPVMTAPGCTP